MYEAARTSLRVCVFKGLQNLPLYVGRQQGFFIAHGLDVEIVYTAGSAAQFAGLAQGEYDLIQTAPDNVVNYNNNPAELVTDLANAARVVMLSGGSTGPLSVYAQPTAVSCADLRGSVLGVDNPSSGFALVLRDMLARNGLELERDYTFAVAGGTSARLDALASNAVAATILYAPFDIMATERGFRRLIASTNYYAAYASLCTAGVQKWLETHSGTVIGYIIALRQALRWIYDPAHKAMVQEFMVREPSLKLTPNIAVHAYTAFVDPATGFGVDGMLNDAALQQVIELRAAYSPTAELSRAPADYYDLRWYRQADERIKQL
jgi:ABC-type nitrate/sulfonate/bicarbonate transport system substrate-binding protein